MFYFIGAGVAGILTGWAVAYFRKRSLYDQLHSAAVMGLIFTILSVVLVVILGWIAMGQ
ncbi:MAG: hypothetical protein AAF826_09175 [Pseudomonadota bacterium]